MTDSSLSGLELGAYETSHFGRFLSERPVEDPYGVIETPRNSGPISTVVTVFIPTLRNNSARRTWHTEMRQSEISYGYRPSVYYP